MNLGVRARWCIGSGVAVLFFVAAVSIAGNSMPSGCMHRFESLRCCSDVLPLLGQPDDRREGLCSRLGLLHQDEWDFGLLLSYSVLTGALFRALAAGAQRGAPPALRRAVEILGTGLAVVTGLADATENFAQVRIAMATGPFDGRVECPLLDLPLEVLAWANPLKWFLLSVSALAFSVLFCAWFRGVGRGILAVLYFAAAVVGWLSLGHVFDKFLPFMAVLAAAWLGSIVYVARRPALFERDLKHQPSC